MIHCNFCNKNRNQVKQMIAGPDFGEDTVYICDECVDFSYDVLHDKTINIDDETETVITPEYIKSELDKLVIEQDYAKRVLSVALYNHLKRINNNNNVEKSNILMIGPSGCGKTQLVKTLSKLLDLPMAMGDATTLTETGYVGDDAETLIRRLIDDADGDISLAQKGVIYIDEIDKKSRQSDSQQVTRDVSGEGVQHSLLKMIEGTTIFIEMPNVRKPVPFSTDNVLFIASGAFSGLERIIELKNNASSMGFKGEIKNNKNITELMDQVTPMDLVTYGLIPELVGRFPVIVPLHELDKHMLYRILIEPANNLVYQYKELFHLDNVELEFSDDFLRHIAQHCYDIKIGARGLRGFMEKSLLNVQFQLPMLSKQGIKKIMIDPVGEVNYIKERKKTKSQKK